MLTLIIRAGNQASALVETLTPLVDGVVRGLAGRLLIIAETHNGKVPHDDISRIADEAGAELVLAARWAEGLQHAANLAKGPDILIADAGVIADLTLWPAVERHLRADAPHLLAATRARMGLIDSLKQPLHRLSGSVSADQILIIRKADISGNVWGKHYGRRLSLLETISYRIKN